MVEESWSKISASQYFRRRSLQSNFLTKTSSFARLFSHGRSSGKSLGSESSQIRTAFQPCRNRPRSSDVYSGTRDQHPQTREVGKAVLTNGNHPIPGVRRFRDIFLQALYDKGSGNSTFLSGRSLCHEFHPDLW